MSGIHDAIMQRTQTVLQKALIDDPQAALDAANADLPEGATPLTDPTIAGIVVCGPLQGNPDPDQARISVTIHENDPDQILSSGLQASTYVPWIDSIEDAEIGGCITWRRRFTVKARCLLVNTREDLELSRSIASTIRTRIEMALLRETFSGVSITGEYVAMGAFRDSIESEMMQAGGPDSYDFHVRVRFEVLTTQNLGG